MVQEQLREKEQIIHDLEKKMEDKDKEILAIKRDNEAVGGDHAPLFSSNFFLVSYLYIHFIDFMCILQAWAKEDLLREQKKELATFRYSFSVMEIWIYRSKFLILLECYIS